MTSDGAILVGDVGGTNVRFACARASRSGVALSDLDIQPADRFASFEAAVGAYLDRSAPKFTCAAFAVAGPVAGGAVELTNRLWRIDAKAIAARFALNRIDLFNDFEALARGAPEVGADAYFKIKHGEGDPDAPVVVGGPGTGFGMATLLPAERSWRVLKGEGGHQEFAPQTEIEWDLAEALRPAFGCVSVEVVAGGLHAETVREALCEVLDASFEPLAPGEVIARAAGGDEVCRRFCEIRAAATMAALGDAALLNGAKGGVVIAGGVARALKPFLSASAALERFGARGPMTGYLADAPVRLLESDEAPLLGAARLVMERG